MRASPLEAPLQMEEHVHDSIVVSIPACRVGDQGSIPCRGGFPFLQYDAIISRSLSSEQKAYFMKRIHCFGEATFR